MANLICFLLGLICLIIAIYLGIIWFFKVLVVLCLVLMAIFFIGAAST